MLRFVVPRLMQGVLVLFVASLGVFIIFRMIPGDPASAELGPTATKADIEALRDEMHLNDSWPRQYQVWLSRIVVGDFGRSIMYKQPVSGVLWRDFKRSLPLIVCGMVFANVVGIAAGVLAASKQGGVLDRLVSAVSLFGYSMPSFWLGLMLIYFFSVKVSIFPPGGMNSPLGGGFADLGKHLVLPAITLGLVASGGVSRLTRSLMLEVLRQDYMRTARAKGLREWAIMLRHGLRNAAAPLINVVALQLGYLMSGSVVIETVFAWPGIGQDTYKALTLYDYPFVQAATVCTAAVVVLANLTADILSGYLNPAARFA